MQLDELTNLLTQNSQEEITDDVPWANGTYQQVQRVMRVAEWAALSNSGNLFHIAPTVDNVSLALAAVARIYFRKLYIMVPWENADPNSPFRTVVKPAENVIHNEIKPFKDIIVLLTARQADYQISDLCFSFVCAPPDLGTIKHDIITVGHSWLIGVDNVSWEPGAMQAIMNTRYLLQRGLLLQCRNREGYLTLQN